MIRTNFKISNLESLFYKLVTITFVSVFSTNGSGPYQQAILYKKFHLLIAYVYVLYGKFSWISFYIAMFLSNPFFIENVTNDCEQMTKGLCTVL